MGFSIGLLRESATKTVLLFSNLFGHFCFVSFLTIFFSIGCIDYSIHPFSIKRFIKSITSTTYLKIIKRNYNLIVLATLYCHPIEFLFGNLLPMLSGILILKSKIHSITFATWIVYRILFTFEEHSGFDFPWHLNKAFPFTVCADHHNFHHEKNIGNYSEFSIFWDRLFGTDTAYHEYQKSKIKNK